jgi:hypothetical protein
MAEGKRTKHAGSAADMTRDSTKNLSTFTTGRIAPCLHNVGNADRLLKLRALMNIFLENANRELITSYAPSAKESIELKTFQAMIVLGQSHLVLLNANYAKRVFILQMTLAGRSIS